MCVLPIVIGCSFSHGQQLNADSIENPIYIADSPIASDSLARLTELIALNNFDEAARLTQRVITDHGDRLIESGSDGVFVPVRDRIYHFVLSEPTLLSAYRTHITPGAQRSLDEGDWRLVAQSFWLTEPGFIASIYSAQTLIEAAHFQAGLRVLNELNNHPDARILLLAQQVSRLTTIAAAYLNTDDAWMAADRWSMRAFNSKAIRQAVAHPSSTEQYSASTLDWNTRNQSGSISLDGVVSNAIATNTLTPLPEIDQLANLNQPRISGANWDPTAWIMPAANENMLFTNDGITVSGFDRFTLRPVWRLQTAKNIADLPTTQDARSRIGRIIEDTTTITVIGDDLYVPSGLPRNGSRVGDHRLLKLNANDGSIQWAIDIRKLDPSLKDASIRGQVIVDQGTVVVGARTNNRKKRLISLAIVGIDAITGKKQWIRQIASAGSLPFQQMGQLAHSPVLDDGVIYWTDYIGLGFAIEAATGRVLWAAPLPPPDLYARFTRPSFSNNTPVITEDGFFALSTDGSQILQLNLQTGKIIATRPAIPVGESLYLLSVDGYIACVSDSRIVFYSSSHFATATPIRSSILGGADGIRGRVTVIGTQLIVPTQLGIELIDSARPQRHKTIELSSSGNILALDGQLVVVDEMNISNFLSWKIASAMLEERIIDDPGAAITFAELAFKADQTDRVLDAVVRAISVINTLSHTQQEHYRQQLFQVILDMVDPSRRLDLSTPNQPLASNDQRALLSHLSLLARSHTQIVAHRMALGSWNEKRTSMSQAIGAYQDILDQPALSASMWEGAGIAVRGGLEASRRISTILNTVGYTPYQPFNQHAENELVFIEDSINPDDFEQLARRYPWASITPSIWLNAAQLWSSQSQSSTAINAASNGLDAAIALSELGVPLDQHTIDLLAEQAITVMINTNRAQDAQTLALSISQQFPKLTLQIAGEIITHDQIAIKAARATQLPTLGDAFLSDEHPILLTGSPIKPGTRIDPGGVLMYSPQYRRVEYQRAGRGVFETIWSRVSTTGSKPIVPWQDQTRTLILWAEVEMTQSTGVLEAIDTTTGRVAWSIENLRTTLTQGSSRLADTIARAEAQFTSPTQGSVLINQLIVVTDGHTVIVTDRIGRAMGIDLQTGKQLWRADLPANRIYDLDINSGVLGICGIMLVDQPTQQQDGVITSIVASINPRTGQTIQLVDRFGQFPRWVRVGAAGNLFVATTERIMAINTKEGTLNWIFKDNSLVESTAGWISGDLLIVLDDHTDLWALSLDEGTHTSRPLDLRQRIPQRGWVQLKTAINSLIVASSRGIAIFNREQNLIADDSMNAQTTLIDIAWGNGRIAYIQDPETVGEHSFARLALLDQRDARLLDTKLLQVPAALNRRPSSITAINGGLIVGYDEVSLFVRTTPATQ